MLIHRNFYIQIRKPNSLNAEFIAYPKANNMLISQIGRFCKLNESYHMLKISSDTWSRWKLIAIAIKYIVFYVLYALGINLYAIFLAAMADIKAPKYKAIPTSKLPLKPITIDNIAASTVPITDAITFTPQSSVISSVVLRGLSWKEEEAILVMDGN